LGGLWLMIPRRAVGNEKGLTRSQPHQQPRQWNGELFAGINLAGGSALPAAAAGIATAPDRMSSSSTHSSRNVQQRTGPPRGHAHPIHLEENIFRQVAAEIG
jgi:hypothetical protein